MTIRGKAWKFGDDIDTDIIIPARYLNTTEARELAAHCMEPVRPDFPQTVRPGDVVVGGKNFGCGSSREQAAVCIKMSGVQAIVARSFARIFFRNCINNGVLPVVCPEAADAIERGDTVTVDLDSSTVTTPRGTFAFPALSPSVMAIIDAGGLIPMLRRKLGTEHLPMPEVKFGGE